MNMFNPLLKELFDISGQNIKRTPQPQRKAPQKKAQPQKQAEPKAEGPAKKEPPKVQEAKLEPKERTIAGIPINSQTVRQGIIMSEILGKPVSKRR